MFISIFGCSISLLIFLRLLTANRAAIEINAISHEWREYPLAFDNLANVYGKKAIFPVHGLLKLEPRLDTEVKRHLWQHCTDLRDM